MNPQAPALLPARILIIDDEPDLRTLYELTLLRQGYRVEAAGDLQQAREHLKAQRFDAVITDMRLPDGLGLELLRDLAAQHRSERCVVITAHGSAENAVEALKAGAFDYLTKPVDLKQFRSVVASAIQETTNLGVALPKGEARMAMTSPGKPADAATMLQKLVGESPVMRAVKSRIVKVAGSMAPVLIRGESGTGKELVARAVHGCSHRAASPFVAVNCSAIPENLLEAEFFGARKGAYTGAAQDRQGYFQAAKGGTLFLDEIGDLPLAMQSKLLRAIQERTVRSLGSPQEETVDVRIVSATHKDLAAGVEAGTFRQDLYYRLNVIEVVVPPLRERLDDLPALCNALLARICNESGLDMPELSPAVIAQLRSLPLNGNVRELENILHRAVALGEDSLLQVDAPPEEVVVVPENLQNFLDQQERSILTKVLQETGFNRTAAATRLGLSLRQIRYRIARLGITTPGHDDAAETLDDFA
ncbi:sigma-54-dependent transcriptional regulator [Polaromonas naphthalenivorans]|uniref:Two component, sigma54 specific, transcriptional regulator, Fis family n=1 Tax=Polaromonas naphthalenivorans (strain CJ2) TaxID=365044 RepID=A1VSQ2_POLNA|nr:sigma-54 dependent transcriptional regulator [Polaromonas naphthalenivorans]ABM38680.1 two component, sigma54 specific, transcriptional regulator, Fis family [Polaromonas naphthalenivorans CJ2]